MTAFAVPRYLAETARRDKSVSGWIAGLPAIVADLAGRWSLQVGEPFQPGGQCSWTAPVTDPAGAGLVLKVGFRFPGGEERDEAAGLRLWDGNDAVRLQAACESESAYALLIERCLPGNPAGSGPARA
jgi:streptomycin 6-kinase